MPSKQWADQISRRKREKKRKDKARRKAELKALSSPRRIGRALRDWW